MSYREITSNERSLLERLLSFRLSERNKTDVHVEQYCVEQIDKAGSLEFAHNRKLEHLEQQKFPVEAQCQDIDGIWIHALLFLVDGKIDELEIYKDDSSPIIRMPQSQDWEIFELPYS